jgi:hypothetical protein
MRHTARSALLMALTGAILIAGAPSALAAFGSESFEAGTCLETSCKYTSPAAAFYTQAAGHPPWGITRFELNHSGSKVEGAPLRRIRVDVPPGLAADPEALPACTLGQFEANGCPVDSKVGTTELEAILEAVPGVPTMLPKLLGNVYNLDTPPGLPLDFGIDVQPAGELVAPVHLFLEGHVDWSGDYHEYFEINNVPDTGEAAVGPIHESVPLTVLMSQLNFNGRAGNPELKNGNFLTLPSECSSTTTSSLEIESYAGEISRTVTHTPVGVEGCDRVPFAPLAEVKSETASSDQPDGATTVVKVPQNIGEDEINTADIRDAHVTLPAGMTLNPAAAHGLETCSPEQIAASTPTLATCPVASRVGTVTIETDLPAKALSGGVYLGAPGGRPIKGPPYTIYLDAKSNSGVLVRLQGSVNPNPSTGRLEVTFANNPQLPFSELILSLNGGAHAPLANPLACGKAPVEYLFTPYTGGAPALGATPFVTAGCPSPIPLLLTQNTQNTPANAGAYTSYTFNLARNDGQQYLSQVKTTLPAGLLGAIPSVALCGEPQAAAGDCAETAKIGTATVTAGAGPEPYGFSGPVYLTGPYDGAPYGLSIPVEAAAGPFDFGRIVTRATISVDPYTARVIAATTNLPTIVGGVPLRLKTLKVEVSRANFLFNPTSCGLLATESALTGFTTPGSSATATQSLSSPFGASACNALAFKPSFKASTSAKTSKAAGASLRVNLLQGAHQANIRSVFAQLPLQLPSRLTTLQKACPEATFAANPVNCRPLGSEVGTATVTTPVLPGALTGSAYLVSHGGAAFPDLDLVLDDGGVRVILVGNTNIKKGITSSTFAAIPDAPVSSFVLNLPTGPHSALTANGSLCAKPLVMPTTITAQNGAQIKQNTRISVSGCPVEIVSHRVSGHKLILKVKTFVAGRIGVAAGKSLRGSSRRLGKASTTTLKIPLSRGGLKALRKARGRHRRLRLRVRVSFVPKSKGETRSAASATVVFR